MYSILLFRLIAQVWEAAFVDLTLEVLKTSSKFPTQNSIVSFLPTLVFSMTAPCHPILES